MKGEGAAESPARAARRKRVVQFATVHPPFDIRVFHRECQTLVKAGYDVTYVVPHDRDEVVSGVRIRAVRKPKTRFERVFITSWKVLFRALAEKGHIYHFHDPELIPAALIMKLFGKRVIYDAHENTPQNVHFKPYIPKPIRFIAAWATEMIEQVAMFALDGLIGATPKINNRFPPNKAALVQNFPIKEEILIEHNTPMSDRPALLIYAGEISWQRGSHQLVKAMALIPKELNAKLVIAGNFVPPNLMDDLKKLPGWDRVEYLGWRPRQEIIELYGKSRVGLVVLMAEAVHYTVSQPAKLYEYMAAGLPVVASNFEYWKELITGIGCGIQVNPSDEQAIADAITKILRDPRLGETMGANGRRAIEEKYNWDVETRTLLALYDRLSTM